MTAIPSRKLAVILHADIVGSTSLVQKNETLAHKRIQEAFRRLSKVIQDYSGTTLELRGDALLAEFSRASDAVIASVAFQAEEAAPDESIGDDIQPRLRIGIAMGEVVVADNTVTGEGVVLAQRLEQAAEPGGVCLQDAAYQTLPKRLPFHFDDLGEQILKGFEAPVRAYAVTKKPNEAIPAPEPAYGQRRDSARLGNKWIVLVLLAPLIIASLWLQPWRPSQEPAAVAQMALPLPDKPSIAILPLDNLTGDASQEVLVDGITDSLVTTLARVPGLFVIDRGTTFSYKDKPEKAKDVAEQLGVHYVLQGSVRRSAERIRISVQLIDASSGETNWAEEYDRELGDIFELQDDITGRVLTELQVTLSQGEQARIRHQQTNNIDAYIEFLQGVEAYHVFTPEGQIEAQRHLSKAIELEPSFPSALAYLGFSHVKQARLDWVDDPAAARAKGEGYIKKALELDPDNADAVHFLGEVLLDAGQREKAIEMARRAVELAPNLAENVMALGWRLCMNGQANEGLPYAKQAMRLSPNYPTSFLSYSGWCYFFQDNIDKAIELNERRRALLPNSKLPLIFLTLMYSAAGRMEEATEAYESLREITPDFSIEKFIQLSGSWYPPNVRERLVAYLRRAGVPNSS